MKIDAFLVLQRSDVAHFAAHQAAYDGVPCIFIEPGLIEDALLAGLDSSRFDFRRVAVEPEFMAGITAEATTRALAIDQAMTRERERLFGAGVLQGWDHALLRLFLTRALTARNLGALCRRDFPERAIGVFRPSRPQLFYFDSFLTTELFTAGDPRWRVVDTYDATRNWVETLANCFDFDRIREAAGAASAVTHIPTCYADGARFVAEIVHGFATNIDLPSPFWDQPVRRGDRPLLADLRAAEQAYPAHAALASGYREHAWHVLDEHFRGLPIGDAGRRTQLDYLADQCRIQAFNFLGLRDALRGRRPAFIVADQDTGSNGPLFSIAAELDAPITILPHSSYPTTLAPHARRVVAIERNGCRTPVRTVLGDRVAMQPAQLGARPATARGRIQTVCLLLNTMYSDGLSYIDFYGLEEFHRLLAAACRAAGVALWVRPKPSRGSHHVLSGLLGIPLEALAATERAPLESVAERADLCVSYGEPSTAVFRFLDAASFVLNVNRQQWPSDYLFTPTLFGERTLPVMDHAQAIEMIATLARNPEAFIRALESQQQAFRRRMSAAGDRIFAAASTAAA